MAQDSFRCRLVTPTAELVDEPVVYANVPLHDGLMGFAPGRAPIVAELGMGELHLSYAATASGGGAGEQSFLIEGGFAKMSDEGLTILAEVAIPAEQITPTDADAELREAEARTMPDDAEDKAAMAEQIRVDRERARLKVRIASKARAAGGI